MFKRLFWLLIGFTSGLGTSWYVFRSVKRTVRRTVEACAPGNLASRAGNGYRGLRVNMRAAWLEGRDGMRTRESELWARVEANRNRVGDPNPATPVNPTAPAPVDDELAARRQRSPAAPTGTDRT